MRVLEEHGNDTLAKVYVAELDDGEMIEFVESTQPPRTMNEKWVNIISTMAGCPVGCAMCDAGGAYKRKLHSQEMKQQIDHLVKVRFPDGQVETNMWKIQLARMGEPTMNLEVLEFLETLAGYRHDNLVVSLSTVAPKGSIEFLKRLQETKDEHFSGRFQLQFSIHSTDNEARRSLIPVPSLSMTEIAEVGIAFRKKSDRKVTLNFTVMKGVPINTDIVARHFDTEHFLIKLTPMNPTGKASCNGLESGFRAEEPETAIPLVSEFESKGFETILSIGELEENQIGSNCGQYVNRAQKVL